MLSLLDSFDLNTLPFIRPSPPAHSLFSLPPPSLFVRPLLPYTLSIFVHRLRPPSWRSLSSSSTNLSQLSLSSDSECGYITTTILEQLHIVGFFRAFTVSSAWLSSAAAIRPTAWLFSTLQRVSTVRLPLAERLNLPAVPVANQITRPTTVVLGWSYNSLPQGPRARKRAL